LLKKDPAVRAKSQNILVVVFDGVATLDPAYE
jgi:hypothetical protein